MNRLIAQTTQPDFVQSSLIQRLKQLSGSTMPVWVVTTLSALMLTMFYNQAFYAGLNAQLDGGKAISLLVFSALLFLLNHLIVVIFTSRKTLKPWLVTLLLIAAMSSYFMSQYGVMIDREMIQNTLETDVYEVGGLLDSELLWHLLMYFALPAWLLAKVKIRWASNWRGRAVTWVTLFVITLMLTVGLLSSQYQLFSSVFRNFREIKHLATPFNGLDAVGSLLLKRASERPIEFQHLALDAHITSHNSKPDLLVLVVGETARADHFSLNGYNRETTPRLESRKINDTDGRLINFSKVSSCGTATAISVPCMFSALNHKNYNEHIAKNSDNLLDIAQRAGLETEWIDNNSGCKGVCERVPTQSVRNCPEGDCSDLELVSALRQELLKEANRSSRLIVLHQLGSHGPEYFKRSLPSQKHFEPECQTNQFQTCERQSIVNAYDNSIVATDAMLDETIALLEELKDKYNTALVYVSDHGESLGEEGIYLHGLPYTFAPDSQTHVPMMMWLSREYSQAHQANLNCLVEQSGQTVSHDDIFPAVIEMLNIESSDFAETHSKLSTCLT